MFAGAVLFLGLVACGGSSEQVAGIDGSGVRIYASGPIEAFGSIVLNGEHFGLESAVIRVNGEVATEQDLALGQVVVVDAHVDDSGNAIADSVTFDSSLRGPIQLIDAERGVLVVLEQQVRVGSGTVLDPVLGEQISDLALGDFVEVSGLARYEGAIDATHIAAAPSGAPLRIVGIVDDLDFGQFRFSIGELDIDYASAGLIDGFPTGSPREDDAVLVIGERLTGAGTLLADRLEFVGTELSDREGYEAEVEGRITRFMSAAAFDVAGVSAAANGSTVYEGGSAGDLRLDLKIQIEGRIDADGTIVARKIEIKAD